MKLNRMLPPIYRFAVAAVALATVAVSSALAQAPKTPTVPGEIILYMQPGVPKAAAMALAATVNPVSVTPLLLADCYVLELPAARRNDKDTSTAVASLKADARVRYANASKLYRAFQSAGIPTSEPNDPRYKSGEQWNLKLIRMPQAWVLQKGSAAVRLGWIDSGYEPTHEDAQGQFDPASFDFADNDSDITADGVGGEPTHGIGTSGIAIANTDNNLGIAGICWTGIKAVALKIQKKGNANFDSPAILNSYAYLLANHTKLNIVAVNMSYGASIPVGSNPNDPNDPDFVATKMLADAGVLMIASAGNDGVAAGGMGTASIPAQYSHVISVAAIDRNAKLAPYSSPGRIDISAPGGNGQFLADGMHTDADGVLSLDVNNSYGFHNGTSDAAPHVTAVVGLLMSVPGVTPALAKDALLSQANHANLAVVPDPIYGFGILDAYASLARISVQAVILSPDGVDNNGKSSDPANATPPPVETFKPTLSFHIGNVTCDNVNVVLDASIPSLAKTIPLTQLIAGNLPPGITDFSISGACTGVPNPQYDFSFRIAFPTTGFFQHTVQVTATDKNSGRTATDTRLFTITPHTIPSGLSMISIPYFEKPADAPAPFTGQFRDVAQLLGTTPTVYRYLVPAELGAQTGATIGPYAKYTATDPKANVNASFRPPDEVPMLTPPPSASNGLPLDTRPIGLGFFIDAPAAIPVVTFGEAFPTSAVKIPLHEAWNLIGDPFPFAVPFNSTEIELGTGTREPIGQAVDQNLILPHIYRFVGGDYQFSTLPDGNLFAWEGHWVYVVPKDPANINPNTVLSLVVTPTPANSSAGRAALRPASTAVTRVAGSGSWKLQLQAHVGDKSDSNNFVGMSGNATDGNDRNKVPKPPKPDGTVNLAIVRSSSLSTVYSQDIRSLGGTKEWSIVVTTDKPNANVTIEWPNSRSLPKTYSLTLTDKVSGSTLNLRNTSSYQFNSGATPGTRSFSLVARPTASVSGHPVFSNIVVNPGRTGGRLSNVYSISYNLSIPANVSVSILTPGGHSVAQIVTRAVNAGDNSVSWNGLDNTGHPVASGSYVVQFQAATVDGQTTRVIRPFILTGR